MLRSVPESVFDLHRRIAEDEILMGLFRAEPGLDGNGGRWRHVDQLQQEGDFGERPRISSADRCWLRPDRKVFHRRICASATASELAESVACSSADASVRQRPSKRSRSTCFQA
jgi:hypothetical protein